VEETGIAQQYRDVRITTIYEGTTGIQALDLVGRKIAQDMGATAKTVISQMRKDAEGPIGPDLAQALAALSETSDWIGMTAMGDLRAAVACSVPYLKLWGITAGGWQMARAAAIAEKKIAAGDPEAEFYKAKLATAKFYAAHILSHAGSLAREVIDGSAAVMTVSQTQFDLDRKAAVA
jgi:butyryl-CoA dehydrogenase